MSKGDFTFATLKICRRTIPQHSVSHARFAYWAVSDKLHRSILPRADSATKGKVGKQVFLIEAAVPGLPNSMIGLSQEAKSLLRRPGGARCKFLSAFQRVCWPLGRGLVIRRRNVAVCRSFADDLRRRRKSAIPGSKNGPGILCLVSLSVALCVADGLFFFGPSRTNINRIEACCPTEFVGSHINSRLSLTGQVRNVTRFPIIREPPRQIAASVLSRE